MKPFEFEGERRKLKADYLIQLAQMTNHQSLSIFSNEAMKDIHGSDFSLSAAFTYSYQEFVRDLKAKGGSGVDLFSGIKHFAQSNGLFRNDMISESYEMTNLHGVPVCVLVAEGDEIVFRHHTGRVFVLTREESEVKLIFEGQGDDLWYMGYDTGDKNTKGLALARLKDLA